jgi:hypothetical protein
MSANRTPIGRVIVCRFFVAIARGRADEIYSATQPQLNQASISRPRHDLFRIQVCL